MKKETNILKIVSYVVLGIGVFFLVCGLIVFCISYFFKDSFNAWGASLEPNPGSILSGIFLMLFDVLFMNGGKYTALIFVICGLPFFVLGLLILLINKLVKKENK